MKEALTKPDCIALSEEKAMQYFGKFDCIGRELSVVYGDKVEMKKVSAIYKFYAQSALRIDLLGNSQNLQEEGTSCMILLKEKTDVSAFCERFESTELPTVTGPGYYKLQTLQESYFDTKLADSVKTFSHRQIALLSIGLLSAFLVLFIACFNYVNLSFSRLLKQVNMIHVETLMGASHSYICRQLFIDTSLTVFIAFILSILVMGDILSLFNYFFDARLTFGFILSIYSSVCFSFGHYTGHLYDEETEPHFYQRISAIFSREKKKKTGSDPCRRANGYLHRIDDCLYDDTYATFNHRRAG